MNPNPPNAAAPVVGTIRRTASFTNIDKIVEVANDQEEEDNDEDA